VESLASVPDVLRWKKRKGGRRGRDLTQGSQRAKSAKQPGQDNRIGGGFFVKTDFACFDKGVVEEKRGKQFL
jgi:hypothetical protein